MEIEPYIEKLDQNADELFALLTACTDVELKQEQENTWTILGIAEHILLTEKIVVKLLFHPKDKKSEKEELYGAEKLNTLIVKLRARKLQAPDALQPKGDIKGLEHFKTEFTGLRNKLKEGLRNSSITIDNSIYAHPYLGDMTIRDWLYFIPSHTKRHIDQIAERLAPLKK